MLCFDDIKVELSCQGYKTTHIGISPMKKAAYCFLKARSRPKMYIVRFAEMKCICMKRTIPI